MSDEKEDHQHGVTRRWFIESHGIQREPRSAHWRTLQDELVELQQLL